MATGRRLTRLALDNDGWPILIDSHPLAAAIRLMKDLARSTLYGSPGHKILNRAGRHLLEQWLEGALKADWAPFFVFQGLTNDQ